MVRLTVVYRCTDQPLVRYVLTHGMVCTDKSVCTVYIGSLSDRYIPPVPGGMSQYGDVTYVSHEHASIEC